MLKIVVHQRLLKLLSGTAVYPAVASTFRGRRLRLESGRAITKCDPVEVEDKYFEAELGENVEPIVLDLEADDLVLGEGLSAIPRQRYRADKITNCIQ